MLDLIRTLIYRLAPTGGVLVLNFSPAHLQLQPTPEALNKSSGMICLHATIKSTHPFACAFKSSANTQLSPFAVSTARLARLPKSLKRQQRHLVNGPCNTHPRHAHSDLTLALHSGVSCPGQIAHKGKRAGVMNRSVTFHGGGR